MILRVELSTMDKDLECNRLTNFLIVAGGGKGNKSAANNQNKIISILNQIPYKIFLITSCDKGCTFHLQQNYIYYISPYKNRFLSFFFTQINQMKAIHHIVRNKNIDLILFAFGCDLNILPIFSTKILGKKIILRSDGRPTRIISKYLGDKYKIKSLIFKLIEEINYRLVDCVVAECEYAIQDNDFKKYRKTDSAPLYIDKDHFFSKKAFNERQFDVGYIGRFSEEKGSLNFVKSIKLIMHNEKKLHFFIAGEGSTFSEMIKIIQKEEIMHNVTLHPWISPNDLPDYLNDIKLIVMPSIKEGLPNIGLEAMACGTGVLGTPVGSIPGLIEDRETGFIMEDNSPECIARNVMRALSDPDLERVAERGRRFVVGEFTFEKVVERWRRILGEIK